MPALIPGLTSGINGEKNKYVAIFRFCDILTYPAYFKYVVQNVLTWSNVNGNLRIFLICVLLLESSPAT